MGKVVSVASKLRRDRARRLRRDRTDAEARLWEALRDAYLRTRGLKVLRFWNAEVLGDLDRVAWTILSACRESDPTRARPGSRDFADVRPRAIGPRLRPNLPPRRPLPASPTALPRLGEEQAEAGAAIPP